MTRDYSIEEIEKYKKEIREIVEKFQFTYSLLLHKKSKKCLKDAIEEYNKACPELSFQAKIYNFLNDKTSEYQKCVVCGKELKHNKECQPLNGFDRKTLHCSCKCAQKDPETQEAVRKHSLEKYGVERPQQSEEYRKRLSEKQSSKSNEEKAIIRAKREETCLKKYGVKTISEVPEIKAKAANSFKNRSDEAKEKTRQKTMNTCLKRYNAQNFAQSEEGKRLFHEIYVKKSDEEKKLIQTKRNQTNLARYNSICPMQGDKIKDEIVKGWIEKFGETAPLKSELIRQKIKETNLRKYGTEHPIQSDIIKEKVRKTNFERYGGGSPMCSHDVRMKARSKYKYNDLNFDSSQELAFYIWLKDNNKDFEYHPNIMIEYKNNNGEISHYLPDFKVDGKLYEIKAFHWWDIAPEEKKECIKQNAILLMEKDYKKYVDYVREKYGPFYLKQFKVDKI